MRFTRKHTVSAIPFALSALLAAAACGGGNGNQQQARAPESMPPETTSTPTQPTQPMPGAPESMPPSNPPPTAPTATAPSTSEQMGQPGAPAPSATSPGTQPQPGGATGSAEMMGPLTDEQIAAVTDAIDNGELQQAQLAQQKAKSQEVKRFATQMQKAHMDMKRTDAALYRRLKITPQESMLSTQLQNDMKQMMDSLKDKTGSDFDKEYMDNQVKAHTAALDVIDNRLLPNAKDPQIKADLMTMRTHVAGHLKEAQRVQATLQSGSDQMQPGGAQPTPAPTQKPGGGY